MGEIHSKLAGIVARKKEEVASLYRSGQAGRYMNTTYDPSDRDFYAGISVPSKFPNLVAEYKAASPSKGEIRPGSVVEEIVRLYEDFGVAAISVLTDADFKGELEHLRRARQATRYAPLLRKDFIIDSAQIYEARAYGADAILLIAAILDSNQIVEYMHIADQMAMDCLVEVHNEEDIEKAHRGNARIYGINNRDLRTFETDINTTLRLIPSIPEGYPIVTESGIWVYDDVRRLSHPWVSAMLVGEAIMSYERNPTLEDMRRTMEELTRKSA